MKTEKVGVAVTETPVLGITADVSRITELFTDGAIEVINALIGAGHPVSELFRIHCETRPAVGAWTGELRVSFEPTDFLLTRIAAFS